jgi:hypothetical protein
MSSASEYRLKAARLTVEAGKHADAAIQNELLSMARSYLRLADMAERNSTLDICYETPPPETARAAP